MKTNSSTTDSMARAVGSRGVPRSRWVQRTRIIEQTGGMHAPARAAVANTIHSGQPSRTENRNPNPASTKATSSGSSTRRCPRTSASRPRTGPLTAVATAPTAATPPPRA